MRAASFAVAILSAALLHAAPARAVELQPGDILAVDLRVDRLLRIDPQTGVRTLIASGGLLHEVSGVVVDAQGRILVAVGIFGTGPGIVAVDPETGAQSLVTTGGFLRTPQDITIEADGTLALADAPLLSSDPGRVVRVDPASGAQTLLSQGGDLVWPGAIAALADGDLLVFDDGFGGAGPGSILRIDGTTGSQSPRVDPTLGLGLFVAFDGSDGFYGTIIPGNLFRFDLETGEQTHVVELGNVSAGTLDPLDGTLVVAEELGLNTRITRVDPSTGSTQQIASFPAFVMGLAVVPAPDPVLEIAIDVRPGALVNRIRVGAPAIVFVALRGSGDFDVSEVDPATVRLGPGGAAPRIRDVVADVDRDGFADRVLGFRISETGLAHGDTELCLSGETSGGQRFEGCDRVVPIGRFP